MKVRDLMQTAVFTVGPDDTVDRIFFLMHFEKIRHLPVVDNGLVVGIVSDRDLYKVIGPRRNSTAIQRRGDNELHVIPRRVRHIMHRGVITIEPDADAGKAASIMSRRKIGALPVVQGKKLVAIITATDLLGAFAKLNARLEKAV